MPANISGACSAIVVPASRPICRLPLLRPLRQAIPAAMAANASGGRTTPLASERGRSTSGVPTAASRKSTVDGRPKEPSRATSSSTPGASRTATSRTTRLVGRPCAQVARSRSSRDRFATGPGSARGAGTTSRAGTSAASVAAVSVEVSVAAVTGGTVSAASVTDATAGPVSTETISTAAPTVDAGGLASGSKSSGSESFGGTRETNQAGGSVGDGISGPSASGPGVTTGSSPVSGDAVTLQR